MQNYEAMKNVFGYDNVKTELMLIRDWFMDDELVNDNRITLPKGIMFYGKPGNGKTLLMREYSKSFDCKAFVVEGNKENTCDEIHDVFEAARNESKAIIVIDEIDLLINKDDKIERALQQELDGMNDGGHILVLAGTNSSKIMSTPLARSGRFDRKIYIGNPDRESREEIFIKFLNDLLIDAKSIDTLYIAQISSGVSGSDIKAIVNDAYLRCKGDIKTEDLECSYERVILDSWADNPIKEKDYRVAIHEAGHTVLALRYPQYFNFHLARFQETGGITKYYDVADSKSSLDLTLANLSIGVAGYLAEEMFFSKRDVGSGEDMGRVRRSVERLVTLSGIEDACDTIDPWGDQSDRVESEFKRWRNERKCARLIRTLERDARRYLKGHKNDVKRVADIMMEKGVVTMKEIAALNLDKHRRNTDR